MEYMGEQKMFVVREGGAKPAFIIAPSCSEALECYEAEIGFREDSYKVKVERKSAGYRMRYSGDFTLSVAEIVAINCYGQETPEAIFWYQEA